VNVSPAETSSPSEELSLLGLSILLLLGLLPLGVGVAVRRSDAFYASLVRHAETQRRMFRLPELPTERYNRDRRGIATILTVVGSLIVLVAFFLLAEGLTRP
jgi:hypothetical protein